MHPPCTMQRNQRGSVLIIGLILLTVMSLISVAGLRGTGLQERMAANLRDRNLAFQAAESALRAAETALANYEASPVPAIAGADAAFWSACGIGEPLDGTTCPDATALSLGDEDHHYEWEVQAAPVYWIEQMRAGNYGSLASDEAMSSAPMYRVTAYGVGGTADSVVILQTTYRP